MIGAATYLLIYFGSMAISFHYTDLYHVIRVPCYTKATCRTYQGGCTAVQEHGFIYSDRSLIKDQQNVLVADYIHVFYYY